MAAHLDHLARIRQGVAEKCDATIQFALTSVLECLPSPACHTIRRPIDFQTSGWLRVLPLVCHQFDLSPQQFHDGLSLRYHRSLAMMPFCCGGCGLTLNLSPALDCHMGGLVTQCHNEVRDALGDLAALAYRDVICEPIVREVDDAPALIADLGIRGVWLPQIDALSYLSCSVASVLTSAEEEKEQEYVTVAEACHASFSPFVVTVDGALGPKAVLYILAVPC